LVRWAAVKPVENMNMARQDDIKKLIIQYNRRLQTLKEKQAQYGLETPVSILTEIDNTQDEIKKLQVQLDQFESLPSPSESKLLFLNGVSDIADISREPKIANWRHYALLILLIIIIPIAFWLGRESSKNTRSRP